MNKQQHEQYLRPVVNIVEHKDAFRLQVEMPGVSKDKAQVSVDNGTLLITGEISIVTPEQVQANYAEVNHSKYKRAFTLSRELDAEKISANHNQGLLNISIPKAEHAIPKRLEVQVS